MYQVCYRLPLFGHFFNCYWWGEVISGDFWFMHFSVVFEIHNGIALYWTTIYAMVYLSWGLAFPFQILGVSAKMGKATDQMFPGYNPVSREDISLLEYPLYTQYSLIHLNHLPRRFRPGRGVDLRAQFLMDAMENFNFSSVIMPSWFVLVGNSGFGVQ